MVKRLIALGYGADATNQEAIKGFPVASIKVGSFGVSPTDKTAGFLDYGEAKFTATTRHGVSQAVVGILSNLKETANRIAYISSTELSPDDSLEAEKKLVGKEGWKITLVKTDEEIARVRKIVATATEMMGMLAAGRLSLAVNVNERSKANFEKRSMLDNDLLRVPQESIEDVVARLKNGR
ncbi:isoflavone reductase like P3 [Fusarium pseudocircinatum]|uniref:Isoflavone reductase like P3 n=1 Tax=Fusarium pseudocircinatum TaxID=56676 RepID=A0A8H5KQC1_9HYPO|nr:isoflavone reductase like P3 [Fusarium pseudocircinatum]